jgi:hypothetical protein
MILVNDAHNDTDAMCARRALEMSAFGLPSSSVKMGPRLLRSWSTTARSSAR